MVFAPGRGAQVEHALAGLRIDRARDQHRPARLRHQRAALERGGAVQVVRVVEHDALGEVRRRRAPRRPARASSASTSSRVARSVFTRAALSAGSLSVRIRSRGVVGPELLPPGLRHPRRGCEWRSAASAGVESPSPSSTARPSRAVRRSTAFTNPWPRLPAAFARSTDSVDRRVIGDAVHEQELVDAEPQRRQHRGVESATAAVAERLDHVVERAPSLHDSVREPHRERAVAAVELAAGPPRRGTRGPRRRRCSNTRRTTA